MDLRAAQEIDRASLTLDPNYRNLLMRRRRRLELASRFASQFISSGNWFFANAMATRAIEPSSRDAN